MRRTISPLAPGPTATNAVAPDASGNGGACQPRRSGSPEGPSSRQPATTPDAACAGVHSAGRTGAVHGVLSAAWTAPPAVTAGRVVANSPPATTSDQNLELRTVGHRHRRRRS